MTTTSVPLPSGQNKYTFVLVADIFNPGSIQTFFEQNSSTVINNQRASLNNLSVGPVYGFAGEFNDYKAMSTPVNTLFQTFMTVDNTQANNITIYLNNGSGLSGATNNPAQLSVGTGGFALGSKYSNSAEYFDGYMSEVIVYSSVLSAANRQKIALNEGHYFNISSLQDGFVTIWYDQTGNGYNLTQATTTAQPVINLSGSAPAIFFDSRLCQSNGSVTCEYLGNSSLNQTLSPMAMTALGVGQITANSATSWSGRMLSIYQTGTSDDSNANSALILNYYSTNPITLGSKKDSNSSLSVSNSWGQDFQATSIANGTNRSFRSYQSSTGLVTGTTTSMASESLVMNNIRVGINNGLNNNTFWDGRINELIFFTTALPSNKYQTYESNQRSYYGL